MCRVDGERRMNEWGRIEKGGLLRCDVMMDEQQKYGRKLVDEERKITAKQMVEGLRG